MKQVILTVSITIVFSLSLIYGINAYINRSEFKIGDCVVHDWSNEFETNISYYLILKVGKKMYGTLKRYHDSEGYTYGINYEYKSYFNDYDLTDSKYCPPIGK